MQQPIQTDLVRRAFAHIDAGTTDLAPEVTRNPVATYIDHGWLEREKAPLFRHYPLFVGLSGRIAKPGDYLAEDHAGLPLRQGQTARHEGAVYGQRRSPSNSALSSTHLAPH